MNHSGNELLTRISRLIKQNQELTEENEKLKYQIHQLEDQVHRINRSTAAKNSDSIEDNIINNDVTRFDMVTVMYVRILGFNNILDSSDSERAMDELDIVLMNFDRILQKYNIHKIKTIGDSYMAAGGIPVKNITNPIQVLMALLEMKDFLDKHHEIMESKDKIWNLNAGLHTGPVTANINGKRKLSYDIKGDTVNIVSRIESLSSEGKILISAASYEFIKEFFHCEYYGRMPVKYKADLELFSVKGLKPEFLKNGGYSQTNKSFDIRFKLIQFTDLQEIILDKLEKELPEKLYYHNVKHTVDVVTEVELIGWAEGVSDEEILLLKTAALLHDAGHTISYDNHEYQGTLLARRILPDFGYEPNQIDRICKIIMATKLPPEPGSLLEEIICDADLDYLGRSDMIPVSNTLYRELKQQNKIESFNDWNKLQVKFITGHQYFTKTARKLREVNKQKQIERIKSLIT